MKSKISYFVCDQTQKKKIFKKTDAVKLTPYQDSKKRFGFFQCILCKRLWTSGHSWANTAQKCKSCYLMIYPYRQEKLNKSHKVSNKEHKPMYCGMCIRLGYRCISLEEVTPEDKVSVAVRLVERTEKKKKKKKQHKEKVPSQEIIPTTTPKVQDSVENKTQQQLKKVSLKKVEAEKSLVPEAIKKKSKRRRRKKTPLRTAEDKVSKFDFWLLAKDDPSKLLSVMLSNLSLGDTLKP